MLVFANGCADATSHVARRFEARHLRLHVAEVSLAPGDENSGMARRHAARIALDLVPGTDILVTTDADCELAPGCLDAFCRSIASDADLVCGAIAFSLATELRSAPTCAGTTVSPNLART